MKKLLFLLSSLLLVAVALAKADPTPAACCNVNTDPICPINSSYSPCLENPLVHWCQNTATECPPLTPTPTTPPVGPPFASPTPVVTCGRYTGDSCCSGGTCPGNPQLICRPSDNLCILPGSFRCLWLGGAGGSCQVNSSCGSGTVPNPAYCSQFGDAGSCNGAASQTCTLPSAGGGSFTGFCSGTSGIQTALGCLDITGKQTISQILGWAVVVGGGIAFLLIVYAGFQMATAAGDPKRVKASQELLTAALGGLVLIVISVVLLNFIGVRVLGLDPLGFKSP